MANGQKARANTQPKKSGNAHQYVFFLGASGLTKATYLDQSPFSAARGNTVPWYRPSATLRRRLRADKRIAWHTRNSKMFVSPIRRPAPHGLPSATRNLFNTSLITIFYRQVPPLWHKTPSKDETQDTADQYSRLPDSHSEKLGIAILSRDTACTHSRRNPTRPQSKSRAIPG